MRVSIGPVQYHWPADVLARFYEQAAQSRAGIVYLGETVCAKRREFGLRIWLRNAEMLREAGKEVILSTLALIEAESELSTLKRSIDNGHFEIEANDLGAVETLQEWRLPFVAGPALNVYNGHTLEVLHRCGMRRWAPPVELSGRDLQGILDQFQELLPAAELEVEHLVYGRLPLAYSARCFTARALDLPKDQCGFRCIDYPEGMPVTAQDGKPLFTINGIQTQSALIQDLTQRWPELQATGISILRVSPHGPSSLEIVDALAEALENGRPPDLALDPALHCDGYWYGEAGMSSGTAARPSAAKGADA